MSFLQAGWAVATRFAAPALRLALLWRAHRGKEISTRLAERRGIDPMPRPAGPLLWLHVASVGEMVSVLPVIDALATRAPNLHVLLTTGTVTSARLLERRLPELGLQHRVIHRFAPLDVPQWVARFLNHWRPDVAGFVESELWPNHLAGCRALTVPLLLINARLSPRSFARWRRVPRLARTMLNAVTDVQAQSAADAARFIALGARQVSTPGNLKFATPELPVDPTELARWQTHLFDRPVWLAASTHPGEEAAIRAAHDILVVTHPDLLTILVPRHPERGAAIATDSRHVTARRSLGEAPPEEAGIWIADTLGELGLFYRLAPIVFIGRSLAAPGGGQNPLEPARLGCAVAAGPYMANFADIAASLERDGALTRVPDAAALAGWVDDMLRDPSRRAAIGAAGRAASRRLNELPEQIAQRLLDLMSAGAA